MTIFNILILVLLFFLVVIVVEKDTLSKSWYKHFDMSNFLLFCLFLICCVCGKGNWYVCLFGSSFCKNLALIVNFQHDVKIHRFALHIKICYHVIYEYFSETRCMDILLRWVVLFYTLNIVIVSHINIYKIML